MPKIIADVPKACGLGIKTPFHLANFDLIEPRHLQSGGPRMMTRVPCLEIKIADLAICFSAHVRVVRHLNHATLEELLFVWLRSVRRDRRFQGIEYCGLFLKLLLGCDQLLGRRNLYTKIFWHKLEILPHGGVS